MGRSLRLTIYSLLFAFLVTRSTCLTPKVYRYFGFGSNVQPSTMKALRQIEPMDATAAILPEYDLRFDGPGKKGIEPSAAFVTPCASKQVHGVIYTLSAEDFAKVGNTEGVPFGYRWKRCRVHPYVGDGEKAGYHAIANMRPVEAFTLVSPSLGKEDIPPSSSYLGLIKEGAKLWKFDCDYQDKLEAIPMSRNPGISNILLRIAELVTGTERER
jgi:hypothetical protein